ncbi:MAG: type IV secretory system conjugative DNA transfer family protein [Paracoccaceae bacterium]|nr:type IV secretory system conjugative DNA transfer family protein [Paracoccaceae bacterium]
MFSVSGGFKTDGVAIPNALMFDGPLIVIDTKGVIHDLTAAVRRNRGRNAWQITADIGLDPIKLLIALRRTFESFSRTLPNTSHRPRIST